MIGRSLGRYRIVERLGQGGMGVVYRAEDPRLERDVAIKVVREDAVRDEAALRRFRQEARALSRLVHPNVATLFDFDSDGGVDFLVLEFVPGETLARTLASGPLPEARARAIALEVAGALEAAHEQGIVHRDLKPGNVVITPRGRAKVLDFGLARLAPGAGEVTDMSTVALDRDLVGTVHYMAPEQIRRGPVDPRTDVYAVGVMLYQMTAGLLPFTGDDAVSTMYSIVHEPPRRLSEVHPGVSRELEAIVTRCLAKDPTHRFANARALTLALRGEDSDRQPDVGPELSAGADAVGEMDSAFEPHSGALGPALAEAVGARIRSLAVLPLENRSGDAAQEFFTDGMTDALITDLAQIGALRVISRTSAMRYKGARRPLPEIARELSVDAVVEGSVMRAGDRVRITAQLVEASSDRSLWAQSYERDITDILALQSEVARAIADGIRVRLTPEESARLSPKGPVNPAAHVAYLQGRYLWNRWTAEALRDSLERYQEALAEDPGYALAWAGLADSYNTLGNIAAMPPQEAYARAREAARRGIEIDETLAEPHTSLGYVMRYNDWDWPGAEREFLRAIQLNPGYATARRWYGQFLSGMGRHDEAIAELERALELDPLALIIYTAVGDVLFFARRYERAIAYYRKCTEMDPGFSPGYTDLARVLDQVGRHEEAVESFKRGGGAVLGQVGLSTGLATLLLRAGRREEGYTMLQQLLERSGEQFVSPYGIASFYTAAGNTALALDWLERAYEQRDGTLVWIKVHPRLDPLRGEPRFRDLLARMKLD